ncbi:MAG: hypothetical protein LBQ48_06685 [Oscillospiraceae bacterium]|jgi:hypothetical protein|nr:hypothetical protein [Oscillospiraceae bacterium]
MQKHVIISAAAAALLLAACKTDSGTIDSSVASVYSRVSSVSASAARELLENGLIIDNAALKLGTAVADVKTALTAIAGGVTFGSEPEESAMSGTVGVKAVLMGDGETLEMNVGGLAFYYKDNRKSKGISFALSTAEPFGFVVGAETPDSVKAVLGEPDFTPVPGKYDLFFLPDTPDCVCLRYNAGKYQADFYFTDDALIAATLCDTDVWTGYNPG